MEIVPKVFDENRTKKPEIENIETEKMEYTLIGKFQRTRGLKLFSYDYINDIIVGVEVKNTNTINSKFENGKLILSDEAPEQAVIDNRFTQFEALNMKNAIKRVNKYKSGKIKELFNLNVFNPDALKLY